MEHNAACHCKRCCRLAGYLRRRTQQLLWLLHTASSRHLSAHPADEKEQRDDAEGPQQQPLQICAAGHCMHIRLARQQETQNLLHQMQHAQHECILTECHEDHQCGYTCRDEQSNLQAHQAGQVQLTGGGILSAVLLMLGNSKHHCGCRSHWALVEG